MLRRGQLDIAVSPLGELNPLPPLAGLLDAPYDFDLSALPEHIADGVRYGRVRTMMPYLTQDGYGREPKKSTVDTVVLENSRLRATFLPEWGGRLWSLVDRSTGAELLHVPDVLQPANLALRNAWFAGGVEWNIGTRGHSPFTCSPLFAARVGEDRLRMWEWERVRGVVFSVDAWLPEDSDVLYIGVRIHNPSTQDTPMYWWSNTAVRETDDLRVLAPATTAFRTSYEGTLSRVDVSDDVTFPARSPDAADYFYDITSGRPWIAAIDVNGYGLGQVSTPELLGRKQFCWGSSTGGRRWQEWLGGAPYCEIQAGLACTQYEHVPHAAGESIRWVEAYGPITVSGDDVESALCPVDAMNSALESFDQALSAEPTEFFATGSGWGALEDVHVSGVVFPRGTLGEEQQPWLELLLSGSLDAGHPAEVPESYVHGPEWEERLAAAPANWATHYHLGVIAHADGRLDEARWHYERSIDHSSSAWARRALALIDGGDAEQLAQALAEAPDVWQLAVEAVEARTGEDALALLDSLPPAVAARGRLRLLRVRAALDAGRRAEAAELLRSGIEVADLREGEVSLDRLWALACPGEALPRRYDFRMHGG